MGSIAALLLAIVKAAPAAAKLAEQFVSLYSAYKIQQNNDAQAAKDRRNDSAVDGLLQPPLAGDGTGQHSGDTGRPGVPGDGTGSP